MTLTLTFPKLTFWKAFGGNLDSAGGKYVEIVRQLLTVAKTVEWLSTTESLSDDQLVLVASNLRLETRNKGCNKNLS